MRLFVALAVFEGCPFAWLNSSAALTAALDRAIEAGSFTRYQTVVQPFAPHGITACAVVGESHLTLHSWPEEGRLFVDIASCSTIESVRRGIEAIRLALPQGRLTVLDERVIDPGGAAAPEESGAGHARVRATSEGQRGDALTADRPLVPTE